MNTEQRPAVMELVEAELGSLWGRKTPVLSQVTWSVGTGDYWIVGGSASSGKSDLLTTAAGLLRPRRGTHRLFGRELTALSEEDLVRLRVRVGLVFEGEGRLFNRLTVMENLALPLCYHRNCDLAGVADRVEAMLEFTGLSSFAHNTPENVTRAFRQRIVLARALMLEPEVLFLDSPLRGQDPRQTRWWLDFRSRLRAGRAPAATQPMTLVVSADNLSPWLEHAEQFAVIAERRVIGLGDRAQVRRCSDGAVRELLADDISHN